MQRPPQESRTPSDLNNYERDGIWQAPRRVRQARRRWRSRRRHALELQPQAYPNDEHLPTGTDDASRLDVPAFLEGAATNRLEVRAQVPQVRLEP